MKKFLTITILIIVLVAGIFIYWRYFWVFGEGVKSGQLNFMVKKGYVFKTYEGKLIQSGFRGGSVGVQSYEFVFSVVKESVAQQLMVNSGKTFDLHYKEYQARVPWRGNTEFIVDSIISMK